MKIGILMIDIALVFFQIEGQLFAQKTSNVCLELNQNWRFHQEGKDEWLPATVPGTVHTDLFHNRIIPDPFYRTNERDLQWIDKVDWEYKTTFNVTDNLLLQDRIELVCKGLDTYAGVYLNGSLLLSVDNMFREWRADCKPYLKAGNNELTIYFHSPVKTDLPKLEKLGYRLPAVNDQSENGGLGDKKISPFARKAGYHYGWDWGPRFVTSGIWRPIYLIAWDKARFINIQFLQTDITKDHARIRAIYDIEAVDNYQAILSVKFKGALNRLAQTRIMLKPGLNRAALDVEIENPILWWCNGLGEPHLYTISSALEIGESLIDTNETNIGIRTLKVIQKPDAEGKSFYFELNGTPVFAKGANYIPLDNFVPRVTPQRYEGAIKSAADANMNMLRVWGGGIYENDIFYDLCDRYGIMIWHDFMFACAMYPGDDAFLENVKQEAIQNVIRLRNHPCLALWCGNNEIDAAWSQDAPGGWGWKERLSPNVRKKLWHDYENIFHRLLPKIVAEFDPKTFYWPSSPLADWNKRASYESTSGDMHYWGVWHGREPFENFQLKIGRFMSEYGFQSFPEFTTVKTYTLPEDWDLNSEVMAAHQRSGIGNRRIKEYMDLYYRNPKDFESLLYVGQVLQAEGIKSAIEAHRRRMPYCMGSLYWQLNDCWPVASWSSTDYFGRWKALHYFAKKAFAPILISPTIRNDSLNLFIISDQLNPFSAELKMVIMDFSGNQLWQQITPVKVQANTSHCYFSQNINVLLNGMRKEEILLITSLIQTGQIRSQNILYFLPVKQLNLPDPIIKKQIIATQDGYRILLTCNKLAKNIYLSANEINGFFSDNYFDLLPGEEKSIDFLTNQKIEDLGSKLKIISLIDSY